MKIKKTLLNIFFLLILLFPALSSAENKSAAPSKLNSNQPIEISSDSLELLQQKNQAIFRGHVIVVQGDVHIKSEKMTVFYKNSSTDSKSSKGNKNIDENGKTPDSAISEKSSIEKIIVEKNVFLSTPEETASGANGIYDVLNKKIYLNDNVVLTRGKNVLKGNKLIYDFETGKSNLSAASVVGQDTKESGGNGRVKALFIPENNKENSDKK